MFMCRKQNTMKIRKKIIWVKTNNDEATIKYRVKHENINLLRCGPRVVHGRPCNPSYSCLESCLYVLECMTSQRGPRSTKNVASRQLVNSGTLLQIYSFVSSSIAYTYVAPMSFQLYFWNNCITIFIALTYKMY